MSDAWHDILPNRFSGGRVETSLCYCADYGLRRRTMIIIMIMIMIRRKRIIILIIITTII